MKRAAAITAAILTLSMAAPAWADTVAVDSIKTVEVSEWANESVDRAIKTGITEEGRSYEYTAPITREQFCELAYNLIAKTAEMPIVNASGVFSDTDNKKVLTLYETGIINGKSETEFAPNDEMTREETAVIIERIANKVYGLAHTELHYSFEDEDEVSDWAKEAVQTVCNLGVMQGVGENRFAPKMKYTAEQAIVSLMRMYDEVSAVSGIIGSADGKTEIEIADEVKFPEIEIGADIEVGKFYIEEALKLAQESSELIKSKEYRVLMSGNEEMEKIWDELVKTDYTKPKEIYCVKTDKEKIKTYLAENTDKELDTELMTEILYKEKNYTYMYIVSLVNSSYGVQKLAALANTGLQRGYIKPKDYEESFALYIKYDGRYSVIVSFTEIGEDVIYAQQSFVYEGGKASVRSYLEEMRRAIGDEGVKLGKVKSK